MNDLSVMEAAFKEAIKNMKNWAPEEVIQIDEELLNRLNLLNEPFKSDGQPLQTNSFHFVESDDKVTLFNNEFVIWIVPENEQGQLVTYTLIALNHAPAPHLELVFVTEGDYNNSHLVLRLLEKFLSEIQETEEMLQQME